MPYDQTPNGPYDDEIAIGALSVRTNDWAASVRGLLLEGGIILDAGSPIRSIIVGTTMWAAQPGAAELDLKAATASNA